MTPTTETPAALAESRPIDHQADGEKGAKSLRGKLPREEIAFVFYAICFLIGAGVCITVNFHLY